MSWLSDLIGGSAGEIIESVGNVADKFITTEEDREEWKVKEKELLLKFKRLEIQAEEALLSDKQSARDMYEKDSSLQKIFAIMFLGGYISLTGFILYVIFGELPPMDDWQVALVSSVFTAMSTKVNTIVDFLFGGSTKADNSEKRMVDALKRKESK